MTDLQQPSGYSATVRLRLRLADRVISLAQVGRTTFRTRVPVALPPGPAMLEIEVDGSVSQTRIVVAAGESPAQLFHYGVGE